jgi:hypothetical protein
MTEDVAFVAFWMFMSAAVGFMIGDAFGDSTRHRKCLEQANEDLRDEIEKARSDEEPIRQELKQQRGILDDIHRYLLPVSKGSEKTTG